MSDETIKLSDYYDFSDDGKLNPLELFISCYQPKGSEMNFLFELEDVIKFCIARNKNA